MKDADYLHGIFENAVDSEIRQPAEDEFARVWLATGPSVLGELCKQIDVAVDG